MSKGIRVNMKDEGYDWIDPVVSTSKQYGILTISNGLSDYMYKLDDMLEPPFEYDTDVEESGYVGTPYENNVYDNRQLKPGVGTNHDRFIS